MGCAMKKVEVIIKPRELETIRQTLSRAGVVALTVSEIRSFGRHSAHTELYRGAEYAVESCPKLKLELVVPDDEVDEILSLVCGVTRGRDDGDGTAFVASLEDVVRLRTGEHVHRAL